MLALKKFNIFGHFHSDDGFLALPTAIEEFLEVMWILLETWLQNTFAVLDRENVLSKLLSAKDM